MIEAVDNIELLQTALKSCPIGVAIFDTDIHLLYTNDAFNKLTKTSLEDVKGQKWRGLIHPNDLDNVLRRWAAAREEYPIQFDMTFRWVLSENEVLWVNVKSSGIYNSADELIGYVDMVQDQSDEKNYEEKIITEIMESEDLERRRFANELHDGLGQNLTAAFLNLETIRGTINNLDTETREKFNTGVSFINEAITETRSIAHNIMPKAIDDFGFVITVEGMIEGLKEVTDIEFTFYHNLEDARLNSTLEFNLYRITQEALNNVLKHSKASRTTIQLIKYDDQVILTIEDNGQGFNIEELGFNLMDFGISSMRNRANSISASINIDTYIGKGTTITVEAPII